MVIKFTTRLLQDGQMVRKISTIPVKEYIARTKVRNSNDQKQEKFDKLFEKYEEIFRDEPGLVQEYKFKIRMQMDDVNYINEVLYRIKKITHI